jgi:hypothetical protein
VVDKPTARQVAPAGQALSTEEPAAQYEPVAHAVVIDKPVVAQTVPFGHKVGELIVFDGQKKPVGQGIGDDMPEGQNEPSVQTKTVAFEDIGGQ